MTTHENAGSFFKAIAEKIMDDAPEVPKPQKDGIKIPLSKIPVGPAPAKPISPVVSSLLGMAAALAPHKEPWREPAGEQCIGCGSSLGHNQGCKLEALSRFHQHVGTCKKCRLKRHINRDEDLCPRGQRLYDVNPSAIIDRVDRG